MWKKLISLNLALILLLGLLPLNWTAAAATQDGNGYAVFYKNDGTNLHQSHIVPHIASNGCLQLYSVQPDFTQDGQVVTSYNSKADGTGLEYPFCATLSTVYSQYSDSPTVLYAQWEDAPELSIRYISTQGLTSDGKGCYVDSGLFKWAKLQDEELFCATTEGNKIVAWSTDPNGESGTTYLPGENIWFTENLTLYSVFGAARITFRYQTYNSETAQYEFVTRSTVYPSEACALDTDWIENPEGKLFVGWNSSQDGSGMWYASGHTAVDAPIKLYAQYENYPEGSYYILDAGDVALESGQQREILLQDDQGVVLPTSLNDGAICAYWVDLDNKLFYPAGQQVFVKDGTTLTAVVADDDHSYVIIDGNGGTTDTGSDCGAVTCSADAKSEQYSQWPLFTREGKILVGFKGGLTGTVYGLSDSLQDAIDQEANANNIACFTAQYRTVTGEYIQYLGNTAETRTGKQYLVQSDLDFSTQSDAVLMDNSFLAPDGMSFLGWNTQADGKGCWYQPGDSVHVFDANTVLYAIWGTWRVTYHTTSASGETTTRVCFGAQQGGGQIDSYRLDTDTAIFEGWNTSTDGTGTWFVFQETIPAGTITDLYPCWAELPTSGYYYVLHSFKLDSGKMAEIFPLPTGQATITLPSVDTAPSNYTKLGWCIGGEEGMLETNGLLDQQENIHTPGSSLLISSGDHLYPVDAYTCAHLYSNLDDDATVQTIYCLTTSGSLQLYHPSQVFDDLPEDAEFRCWNTQVDSFGTRYDAGYLLCGGHYTLYAQWSPSDDVETVPMYRMYDPNSGEHFYTGSEEERDILIAEGWNYEGVAFNFPIVGVPVHRLYDPDTGDHLYTMDQDEMDECLAQGWIYEGVAFNSAASTEVPQYRLWNPNAYNEAGRRGAWHFTSSREERDTLIRLGWRAQGIGWYSTFK